MDRFLSLAEQVVKDQEATQEKFVQAFQPMIDYFTRPPDAWRTFLKPLVDFIKANHFVVEQPRRYHVITKRLRPRR